MSIGEPGKLSILVNEGPKKNGQRTIEGYVLEIPNSFPTEDISGRTDGFQGQAFSLTIAQAEALHNELGKSLGFIKPLLDSGKLKETIQG
jgi:hypothetical protein